jgi:hypothetical protein
VQRCLAGAAQVKHETNRTYWTALCRNPTWFPDERASPLPPGGH